MRTDKELMDALIAGDYAFSEEEAARIEKFPKIANPDKGEVIEMVQDDDADVGMLFAEDVKGMYPPGFDV